MNNNTINLSSFGYAAIYEINEKGQIYNQKKQKQMPLDKNKRVYI